MGDSFQALLNAPCAGEAGVSIEFAAPGSAVEDAAKTGRGFALTLARMLDMASGFPISGSGGALASCEERWALGWELLRAGRVRFAGDFPDEVDSESSGVDQ
jgi:hypothetical protein